MLDKDMEEDKSWVKEGKWDYLLQHNLQLAQH